MGGRVVAFWGVGGSVLLLLAFAVFVCCVLGIRGW